MGKSTYLQQKTLADALGANVYLALYRNSPGDDDEGDEVAGYTRLPVTFTTPSRKKALMMCENSNTVTFPTKSGGYGTITHVGLRDAVVGGNLLYYAQLKRAIRSTNDKTAVEFLAGELKVSED